MTLRDRLREALKTRILHDVGEGRFDPSTWHTTQLGEHYKINDPDTQIAVIDTVLRESFTPIAPLSDANWLLYFQGITAKSTPTSAITRFLQI